MTGLLGHPLSERIGRSGLDLVHPDDMEDAVSALSELAQTAGATVLREVRAHHADGSWRVLQAFGKNLVDDPSVRGIVVSFRDITELRQREESWGESEAQYRALLEHATDGIVVFQDGAIKFANRALAEITGYSKEELVGMRMPEILDPEFESEIEERYRSRVGGRSLSSTTEIRIRRKDGTTRTLEASGTAIPYQGRPADLGIVRDITERRRMETAFAESEGMLRTLVETAPERIVTVDRDGTVLFANRVAPGHSIEEAVGSSLYDYLSPEDSKVARRALRSVFQSSRVERWTAKAVSLDGERRWYKSSAGPIVRDGTVVAAIIVSMDITERKRAEEALAESEEWHRALVETTGRTGLGITITQNTEDREAAFVYVNDRFCLMSGYTRDELLGISAFDTVPPAEREKITARYRQRQKGKRAPGMYEARLLRKDETLLPIETSVSTMVYRGSVATVSFFADVTWRKQAEEELNEYRRSLEHIVEERTAELKQANEELQIRIKEQRQAEKALRESEGRFRALAELLPQIVFEMDMEGKLTFANRRSFEITGYTDADVGKGLSAFDLLAPADRDRARENTRRLLSGEKSSGNEYALLREDGATLPVIIYSSPIIKDDKPAGLRGIAIDITERKQMEDQLRREEEYFRSLIENSLEVILVLNGDGTIRYESPSAANVTGYTLEERQGRSVFELVHPDDLPGLTDKMQRFLTSPGGIEHAEFRGLWKDGLWHHVEATGHNLLHDPAVEGIVVNFRDVTERKQVEEALRHQEEYFRSLIENSSDFIAVIDAGGTLRYESPSVARLTGHQPGERVGGSAFDFIHPENATDVAKTFAELLEKPGGSASMELRFRHKDGSWRVMEGTGQNFLHHPAIQGIVINVRDITERRKAAEQLQELYDQEKALREKLESEMRRRIEFTRALAHELKTPLTSVLASSDLLVSEIRDETLRGLAKNVSQGASKLGDRIDELLDLARGEVGMLQLKTETVDLVQLLREAADRVTPRTMEHGQSLVRALPPRLPAVQADAARLEQVVTNLLDNAIKFTPRGGRITLRARESKGAVTVEVQDTGRGIPTEARERLFEPYQRLESDRENLSGLGLGLSLSKALVELHGGKMWVKSRVGRGSTFGFTLPLRASQQQAHETEQPRKLWRVLMIEDDYEIVDSVALNFRLRWPAAELISTALGEEGIEMVESEEPDVVILDLGLPDISGFEVLRQIRLFSSVPVVILTVKEDEGDMVKGLEWGADDYVVKPFRQTELLARLKVQLRKRTAPDEEAPIVCGSLRLDPSTFQMTRGGEEISLTIVEGRILEHLMRNAGHVVTHASLAEAVWGEDYPRAVDSLRVYIRYLRQKLEQDPSHPKLILTKAGVGYSLAKPA